MTGKAPLLDEFSWPRTRTDWICSAAPPVRDDARAHDVEWRTVADGIDLLDRGEVRAELAPGELSVAATDDTLLCWLRYRSGEACLWMSRSARVDEWIPIQLSFHDDRRLTGQPRFDEDGVHLWLPYATHWEKRLPQSCIALELAALAANALPSKGGQWRPLAGNRGLQASSPLGARDASAVRRDVERAGLSAIMYEASDRLPWLQSGEDDGTDLGFVDDRRTPYAAVVGRREMALLATNRRIEQRLRELGAPPDQGAAMAMLRRDIDATQLVRSSESPETRTSDYVQGDVHVVAAAVEPYELPQLLHFGGFNWCPPPQEHGVFLREWQQRWGARVAAVGPDWISLDVSDPPRSPQDIGDLRWAFAQYCTDDVPHPAHSTWRFWWD